MPADDPKPNLETDQAALGDDVVAILPVRGFVPFPGAVRPLTVGRPRSVAAAQKAAREGKPSYAGSR